MKLPDINLWLAAAQAWLEAQNEPKSIALGRVTQQGLLRLLTPESLMQGHGLKVLTNKEAWALWTKLAADERMIFLAEPDGMERRWQA
ncbi:MAG: VapC toxin family PIN domain ribonuclease [Chthoniobacterales bacterium]